MEVTGRQVTHTDQREKKIETHYFGLGVIFALQRECNTGRKQGSSDPGMHKITNFDKVIIPGLFTKKY